MGRVLPQQFQPAEQFHRPGRLLVEPPGLTKKPEGELPALVVIELWISGRRAGHQPLQFVPGRGIVGAGPVRRLRQVEAARRKQPGQGRGRAGGKPAPGQDRPQFPDPLQPCGQHPRIRSGTAGPPIARRAGLTTGFVQRGRQMFRPQLVERRQEPGR